jgi:hypothetical protein
MVIPLHGPATLGGPLSVSDLTYSETAGGNIFIETWPEQPDVAVVLKSFGGNPPDSGLPYDHPIIQILIRGDEDPKTAIDLWYAIYSRIHGAVQQTLPDGTDLIACLVQQGGPISIGTDLNGRHRFSMNIQMEVVNHTMQRPGVVNAGVVYSYWPLLALSSAP